MVREGYPEGVTYRIEMAIKCMWKELGRVLETEEGAEAMARGREENIVHFGSIRRFHSAGAWEAQKSTGTGRMRPSKTWCVLGKA